MSLDAVSRLESRRTNLERNEADGFVAISSLWITKLHDRATRAGPFDGLRRRHRCGRQNLRDQHSGTVGRTTRALFIGKRRSCARSRMSDVLFEVSNLMVLVIARTNSRHTQTLPASPPPSRQSAPYSDSKKSTAPRLHRHHDTASKVLRHSAPQPLRCETGVLGGEIHRIPAIVLKFMVNAYPPTKIL